jgi:Arc/MetJ-type ribon-helix-helix transcriptional regulator
MKETLVSVRMPDSLYKRLSEMVSDGHYLDLSEEVRSIVRKKFLSQARPEGFIIRRLSSELKAELVKKSELLAQKQLIGELERLKEEISDSALSARGGGAR